MTITPLYFKHFKTRLIQDVTQLILTRYSDRPNVGDDVLQKAPQ